MADKADNGKQHFCEGEWKDGDLKDCPRHQKRKKRQSVPGAKAV